MMKSRIYQENQASDCMGNEELRRILPWRDGRSSTGSTLQFHQNALNQEQGCFTIRRQRTALKYPTFPANPWDFWVPEVCLAAVLDCRRKPGTRWIEGMSGIAMRHGEGLRREPQTSTNRLSWFCRNLDVWWNSFHRTGGFFIINNCTMETPRYAFSELHFGKLLDANDVLESQHRARSARTHTWTHHVVDQWSGDGWIRGIASALRKIISNTSIEESVLKSSEFIRLTDSWEGGKLIIWPQNTQFKSKVSLEQKAQKKDRFLSWLLGHWSERFCRELCRPIYHCSSKWFFFRNSIRNGMEYYFQWWKTHLMTSWKDCIN